MKTKLMAVFILLLASFFLGIGPSAAKEIVVLSQFPLSGPLGSLNELGWGYIDAMNWFNKEAGGVNGKPIKWFLEDMRYEPEVEVANFIRFASKYNRDEFVMASGYITGGIIARKKTPAHKARIRSITFSM